jgi:hypothetical protein
MLSIKTKQIIKNDLQFVEYIAQKALRRNFPQNFPKFKSNTLNYLKRMRIQDSILYKFSPESTVGDLYSTTYALLLYSLFDVKLENSEISNYIEYYDSLQSPDGLYRDSVLETKRSENGDHWGWRHLLPHIIIALDYLGARPKYKFSFIEALLDDRNVIDWLEQLDWSGEYLNTSNLVFNIGVALQYSRDHLGDTAAGIKLVDMKIWLKDKILSRENIKKWYSTAEGRQDDIYKIVKTVYHILPIYYYDNELNKEEFNKILEYAIMTQNSIGGYGPLLFSDSCEDIDSVYTIAALTMDYDNKSIISLKKHLKYIFINWDHKNGGFMFRRNERFQYGDSKILVSSKNQSNMFATWFRMLDICYANDFLKTGYNIKFSKVPGYQFNDREQS